MQNIAQVKIEIANRIRTARKAFGLSQQKLCQYINSYGDPRMPHIQKSRLGNWEQGIRAPGVLEIQVLGHILGVSPAWLMCLDEATSLSDDEHKLVVKYRSTDHRGKRTIAAVADIQPPRKDPSECLTH